MNKILLPIAVLAISGAYVWTQQGRPDAGSELDASLPALGLPAGTSDSAAAVATASAGALTLPSATVDTAQAPAKSPAPTSTSAMALPSLAPVEQVADATAAAIGPADPAPLVADSAPAVPLPRQRPTAPAAAPVQIVAAATQAPSTSGLRDGSFTGPPEDAYYGTVQVQAQVQNGELVKVRILQYPNDRRTSRYINGQAMPMLQQEAIQAQSARIDFVSGATLSSGAFVKSLTAALRQATS